MSITGIALTEESSFMCEPDTVLFILACHKEYCNFLTQYWKILSIQIPQSFPNVSKLHQLFH